MPSYSQTLITSWSPWTLSYVKNFLKIENSVTVDDTLVQSRMNAALGYVQRYTWRRFGKWSIDEYFDGFRSEYVCSVGVVSEFDDFEYFDGTNWLLVDPSTYAFHNLVSTGRLVCKGSAPSNYRSGPGSVRIRYKVGTMDGSDIPHPVIECALSLIGQWWENRSDQDITDLRYINTILTNYIINR